MFDVANWVTRLNGENGPRGTPSHEALSVSPQGALEISSVAGQPPSTKKRKKGLHIIVLELKAFSLALRSFKDQCQTKLCWLQRTTQQW